LVMEPGAFDEIEFYRAISRSGARALLIGRRAIVAFGGDLMTTDYDFWLHADDVRIFNEAAAAFDLYPNRSPEEALRHGRYVLEQDERVDVLIARRVPTIDGQPVSFDEVWSRHVDVAVSPEVKVALPTIDDLILTKRFGARPKDAEDI